MGRTQQQPAKWAAAMLAIGMASTWSQAAMPTPTDDDAAALALPIDNTPPVPTGRSSSVLVEAAETNSSLPLGGDIDAQRLSVDLRSNVHFTPEWRALVADRLDLLWPGTFAESQQINTLKEAYLSWQAQPNVLLDLGRINVRQGVAFGYNPTDFLRTDAIRALDSIDPDSLRQNRLGTVMIRAEQLWDSGALSELYAPKLASHASTAPFDPDFGATNSRNRWLLALSQRLPGGWSPQWLLEGNDSGSPQFGLNTTAALGSATIAYLELSAGDGLSLWDQALDLSAPSTFHARAATGFTYSAPHKVSLTIEYEYDGAALSAGAWAAARHGNLEEYGRYREFVGEQQEPPTQHSAFVYASWQDALVRHLDLSAFVRVDLIDHSHLPWTELRYHWSHVDAAIRWQDYCGGATSDYGASPTRQTWQLLLDYYF